MSDNTRSDARAVKGAGDDGSRSSRRRLAWITGAIVAAVVVVALVVWGVVATSTSPTPASSTASASRSAEPASATPTTTTEPPTAAPTEPAEGDSPARPTDAPVDITEPATPTDGITARLVTIEAVEGEVTIPGEVAGPAVRVTLEVVNDTGQTLETPAVVVNLYIGGELRPAGPLLNPGGKPFPASISAGRSAQGVYLFSVSQDQRDNVTIEVDLAVGTPIVLFEGAVS